MATLVRHGKMYYSYLMVKGKRIHRALHPDRRIAEEMLADIIKERNAGRHGVALSGAAWASFKQRYLAWARGIKAKSSLAHDTRAIGFLEHFRTISTLDQITPQLLEELRAWLITEGQLKPGINRAVQALKTIMRRAEDWNYVRPQKWSSVKKFKLPKGRVDFFTEEEFKKLLKTCSSEYERSIGLLFAYTGVRASEGYWLEWTDVDLQRGLISVVPKPGFTPKDYECRNISLPPFMVAYLKKLKARAKSKYVLADSDMNGWRPPSAEAMGAEFRKNVIKGAGLRGRLHILRHTYASWLAQRGVDLYTIKELLGHASIVTTEIYAHLRPDTLAAAVAHLPVVK